MRERYDENDEVMLDENGEALLDDALTRAGRLFQEYCCMALAREEAQKLRWQATHQKEIRAELYQNLADAYTAHDPNSGEALQAGKRVVLASSFTGGPRDQHQRYQDAMAVVRKRGKPSLFITMTCNPKWKEILRNLGPGELAANRPDIVARVFKLKLNELLHELYRDGIFGSAVAHLHVIEFQKRGLPHAHIIIILKDDDRLRSPEVIDELVRAELPPEPMRDGYPAGDEGEAAYLAAYQEYEELSDLVCEVMTHGPCGAENPKCACMVDGVCSKGYPKPFSTETTLLDDEQIYPQYRRRSPAQGGPTRRDKNGRVVDSSWVVPYSPRLLKKYKCHICVEVCVSVKGVKYLYVASQPFTASPSTASPSTTTLRIPSRPAATCRPFRYKYVYKGPDRAMVAVKDDSVDVNEIELYQDMRSIGASEGCWRTFSFDMYDRSPFVERLQCHLPNQQQCRWTDGEGAVAQAVAAGPPETSLTAWFKFIAANPAACEPDVEGNRVKWSARYPDFPERYRYDKTAREWKERQRLAAQPTIGRVYGIHPNAGEAFYLRMLLHHVPACDLALSDAPTAPTQGTQRQRDERAADKFTSEAFKYVAGKKYDTYQAACAARGLLQDDGEWFEVLRDYEEIKSAKALRELYGYILQFNSPQNPVALFDEFWESMADDFKRELEEGGVAFTEDTLRAQVLLAVEARLQSHGESLKSFHLELTNEHRKLGEAASREAAHSHEPKEIRDELIPEGDRAQLAEEAERRFAVLTESQRVIYNAIMSAIESVEAKAKCIFVDALGGAGKTFTFNAILAAVRSKGEIALAVASSGIAAILLELGRTFHSRFKANRNPNPGQELNISAQMAVAKLIKRAKVIVWDEAAMANRYSLEALDITLRDLMQNELPFGGKVIVLAGDFRQTLPVVKFASQAQTIESAITSSNVWKHFKHFAMTENMRIKTARDALDLSDERAAAELEELEHFSQWLLGLGEGTDATTDRDTETVALPENLCLNDGCSIDTLVDWVYPDLATNCSSSAWLAGRAILMPKNAEVDRVNAKIAETFPGEVWECTSADTVSKEDDTFAAPSEFLNSLNPSGIPAHKLNLKPNMPVMLLRNLSPADGLCNGTRLLVHRVINGRVLKAEIATGKHRGDIVFIPRIKLSPDETDLPYKWSRLQFPVRVSFAMSECLRIKLASSLLSSEPTCRCLN